MAKSITVTKYSLVQRAENTTLIQTGTKLTYQETIQQKNRKLLYKTLEESKLNITMATKLSLDHGAENITSIKMEIKPTSNGKENVLGFNQTLVDQGAIISRKSGF